MPGDENALVPERAWRIPTIATPAPRRLSAKPAIRDLRFAQGKSSPGRVLHSSSRP